jgi:hypothetical protein
MNDLFLPFLNSSNRTDAPSQDHEEPSEPLNLSEDPKVKAIEIDSCTTAPELSNLLDATCEESVSVFDLPGIFPSLTADIVRFELSQCIGIVDLDSEHRVPGWVKKVR